MTETYTFSDQPNGYFRGSDAVVTRSSDSASIKVNLKDGMWAVEVKDRGGEFPPAVSNAIANLPDAIIEGAEEDARIGWWLNAEQVAKEHGFDKVWQAGRSGGWMAVEGTQDWHPNELFEHEPEDDAVERFLTVAFEAREAIDNARENFGDRVLELWQELQHELRDASDWIGAEVRSLDGEPMIVGWLGVQNGRPAFYKNKGGSGFCFATEVSLIDKRDSALPFSNCPNCGRAVRDDEPAHSTGCVIGALLTVLQDRGFDFTGKNISTIDAEEFWNQFGGPAADQLEADLNQ